MARQALAFKRCSAGTKRPKVFQKISPTPSNHHHQLEQLIQGSMHPCFCLHPILTLSAECFSRNRAVSDQATSCCHSDLLLLSPTCLKV